MYSRDGGTGIGLPYRVTQPGVPYMYCVKYALQPEGRAFASGPARGVHSTRTVVQRAVAISIDQAIYGDLARAALVQYTSRGKGACCQ